MLSTATAGVVIAYVLIALLLVSLVLASRWRWWIKGGAALLTALFFVGTYMAVSSILGWPAYSGVPTRFNLLHAKVAEPDRFNGIPGQIFLWVEELDANNAPAGTPRALELPFNVTLAEQLQDVTDRLANGEQIMGEIQPELDPALKPPTDDQPDLQLAARETPAATPPSPLAEALPSERELRFVFSELPPPIDPAVPAIATP